MDTLKKSIAILPDDELLKRHGQIEIYRVETLKLIEEELLSRGIKFTPLEFEALEKEEEQEKSKEEKEMMKKIEDQIPDEVKNIIEQQLEKLKQRQENPRLFSLRSVFLFSVLFSPFISSLLLYANFKQTGSRRIGLQMLLIGLSSVLLSGYFASRFPEQIWLTIIWYTIVGAYFSFYVYPRAFNHIKVFTKRNSLPIFFLLIGFTLAFLLLGGNFVN